MPAKTRCPACGACRRQPLQTAPAAASPRINTTGQPGRVHWPDCCSALIASAGIRGGTVYGESDKIGTYVKDSPVRPQDLGTTIYHALDVPLDSTLARENGIVRPITTGEPILRLFS
jgi:hypothetical protein